MRILKSHKVDPTGGQLEIRMCELFDKYLFKILLVNKKNGFTMEMLKTPCYSKTIEEYKKIINFMKTI